MGGGENDARGICTGGGALGSGGVCCCVGEYDEARGIFVDGGVPGAFAGDEIEMCGVVVRGEDCGGVCLGVVAVAALYGEGAGGAGVVGDYDAVPQYEAVDIVEDGSPAGTPVTVVPGEHCAADGAGVGAELVPGGVGMLRGGIHGAFGGEADGFYGGVYLYAGDAEVYGYAIAHGRRDIGW